LLLDRHHGWGPRNAPIASVRESFDVPTIEEAGVPGINIAFWNGLWAPKGTPKTIIAKLNDAVVEAFADPAIQKRFADLGHLIPPRDQLTPDHEGSWNQDELRSTMLPPFHVTPNGSIEIRKEAKSTSSP